MTAAPTEHSKRQAFTLTWLVHGVGLCLTFGWVYFPAAFSWMAAAYPATFTGTLLSGGGVSAFAAALACGIAANSLLAHCLALRNTRLPGPILHAEALPALLGGCAASISHPLASAVLLGIAASGPGVYWFSRLALLPPVHAGAALAGSATLTAILTEVLQPYNAGLLLPVGLLTGLILSLRPESKENATATGNTPPVQTAMPTLPAAASFFILGITGSAGAIPIAILDLFLIPLGMGIAVVLCTRRSDAWRCGILAIATSVLACISLTAFPQESAVTTVLQGIAEGAAIISLMWSAGNAGGAGNTTFPNSQYLRAGYLLAGLFIVANAGGTAGAALTRTSYPTAGILSLTAAALVLSGAVLICSGKKKTHSATTTAEHPGESLPPEPTPPPNAWSRLTPRENEVCHLLIQGISNPEICRSLFVSANTVRTHMKNIYQKTGAQTRDDLIALLRKDLPPPDKARDNSLSNAV